MAVFRGGGCRELWAVFRLWPPPSEKVNRARLAGGHGNGGAGLPL